ncbi:MAG: HD domain-containing protein [Lachnospiraceae bacterium]|nr:HD domain-containing protein [Lachnospiraceae bacterium]
MRRYENLEKELNSCVEDVVKHSICVSNVGYSLAAELGMPEQICYETAVAGIIHDIGKVKLVPYIMANDDSPYTLEKIRYMRMHSQLSYDILKSGDYSEYIMESVLHHHENYDGSGYPDNLKGDSIPIGARILKVSDVFAALISDRPYRKAFNPDMAVEIMIDEVKNFDMKVFLAFQRVIHEVSIEALIGTERKSNNG